MSKQKMRENTTIESKKDKSLFLGQTHIAHQKYILKQSNNDLKGAIEHYIEAIKTSPTSSNAYFRLATLLHQNGQIGLDSAIEQCKYAAILEPKNHHAHMYLGYFLSIKKQYTQAKIHFFHAIRLKPLCSSRVRLVLGMTLFNELKNTKFSFTNLSNMTYSFVTGAFLFFFDTTNIKIAINSIKEKIVNFKYSFLGKIFEFTNKENLAYWTYSSAILKSQSDLKYYCKMAKIAQKKKCYNIAYSCHKNTINTSFEDPMFIVSTIEFLELNKPEKINDLIDLYTKLVEKNPKISKCFYELGHLYIKKGDKLSAVNAFKMALDNDMENPYYINALAYTYVQLEQYDNAIELYKKALLINPDNEWSAVVAQALAAIYHQVKNNSEYAVSMLECALLLTQDKSQIYLALADIYYDNDEIEKAIQYYNISLDNNCKNAIAYSRLAMAYWEKDYIDKAIYNYTKAINIDPHYDVAYNNLGVVQLDGIGDAQSALAYFETAVDINPKYTLAHFNIARCYQVLGENIEAAKKYQFSLALNEEMQDMDNEMIQEALHNLFKA